MNQSRDICRTCLCVGNTTFLSLDSTFSHLDFISIRETISFCMPEFDFDVVPTSVICGLCLSALQTAFTFKKKCDETQARIQEYIDNTNGIYHTVDLKKVIDFIKLNSNADLLQKELVNSSNEIAVNDDTFNLNKWIGENLLETETEVKPELIEIYDISNATMVKSEPMDYIDELESNGENDEMLEDSQTVSDVENGCKSHKCTVCEKSYKREISLIAHMRTHQINQPKEEPNSTCDPIPYPESDVTGVKQFLPMESDNIDAICKICQESFYSKSDLTIHMRIHTGVKPYKCDICEKAFTQEVYLTAHECTHTGEKHTGDLNNDMLTHTELQSVINSALAEVIPEKSKRQYEKCYSDFKDWCNNKNVKTVSENILLTYLMEKSKILKSSSLWSIYSMLKCMLNIRDGIDVRKFLKVIPFLKRKSVGYQAKKSKVFTREQIDLFLEKASDENYLLWKVVLIMGISGAMGRDELTKMTVDDIQDANSLLIVTVRDTKTDIKRTFTVTNLGFIKTYRKYAALRPTRIANRRFFLRYAKGKCTIQVVGVHKIGEIPSLIAKYLGLPNSKDYTGHCFRRSSLLANAGANISVHKRHGGWRSATVAESYVENSIFGTVASSSNADACVELSRNSTGATLDDM